METEFISREAAISEILSEPTDAHYPSWYDEKLKQIPAADVRPVVRGEFVGKEKVTMCYTRECSNCHGQTPTSGTFCSVCGADMREEADND